MILPLMLFFGIVNVIAVGSAGGQGTNPASGVGGNTTLVGTATATTRPTAVATLTTRAIQRPPIAIPTITATPIATQSYMASPSSSSTTTLTPSAMSAPTWSAYPIGSAGDQLATPLYDTLSSSPSTSDPASLTPSLSLTATVVPVPSPSFSISWNQTPSYRPVNLLQPPAAAAAAATNNNQVYIGIGTAVVVFLILVVSIVCINRANRRDEAGVKLVLPQAILSTTVQTNPINTKLPAPRQQILIDPQGEHYTILNNTVYYLDAPGGRLLAKGWKRVRDNTDAWYVGPNGEASWTPIYHQ